jgi:glucose/arabinose dehydrogenase
MKMCTQTSIIVGYGNSVFKKIKRNRVFSAIAILIVYVFGVISTLAVPVERVTDLKDSFARKIGVIEKPVYPQNIDTSRYSFSLENGDLFDGAFQLAQYSLSDFYALERFSGELSSFSKSSQGYVKKSLGNVFKQLGLPSNSEAANDGYKIDKAGNKLSGATTIFTTAFDIHYAFGRLYVSVTSPSENQTCTALSLYSFVANDAGEIDLESANPIFKTPCILDKMNPTMWGGRVAHSKSKIFLSIGEQRYDPSGFAKTDVVSISEIANKNSVFGKVLEFQPKGGDFQIFASGLRNAQGLYFSNNDDELFESEHGPFGGDEVNILKYRENYGWPFRTFGKPYGLENGNIRDITRSANPASSIDLELAKFGAKSGNHADYTSPIMSWIHSGSSGIGAGQLIKIQKESNFRDWHGDILVAHMRDFSLRRLVLKEKSVVLDERIQLGFRVRDFILNDLGYLILSTDEGKLLIYRTSSPGFQSK